ncbi:MAG: uroporphyrinogen-III synthase [Chromatocurvus sp.]
MTSNAVLVTRPEGQGGRLCAGLAAAGYRAVHQPLLAVSPIDSPDAGQRGIIQALDDYAHCLFVSANAARFGLECLLREWPEWPRAVQCYAVGDSTADVLRAAGLSVLTPGVNMTSEGLLSLPSLQAVSGQGVLIVKGEGGRTALREALTARGARVDELRCYRRSAPDVTPEALQGLLRRERIGGILVSSGEVLDNLMALLQSGENTKLTLTGLTLVVPSLRVAEQARVAGWSDVVVAANASDAAMLAALEQWTTAQGKTVD